MAMEGGTPAPEFKLKDAANNTVSPKSFRGSDLIIYVYSRDSTPGCTKEAWAFQKRWEDFRTCGFDVVGILPDSAESHLRFALKYDLTNLRLLSDPDEK